MTFTAGGTITAPAATNLTLNGGSSGASLALGQGTNGAITITAAGSGNVTLTSSTGAVISTAKLIGKTDVTTANVLSGQLNLVGATNGNKLLSLGFDTTSNYGFIQAGVNGASWNPVVIHPLGFGNLLIGGTTDITGGGGLKVFGTTASTSTTTGSLINAGGFGNAGNLWVGGTGNFAGNLTAQKVMVTTPSALTYAAPTSVDVTLANIFTVTTVNATGSVTFNATAGGTAGQRVVFIITNDATSAKTITFGTNFVPNGTLTPSGTGKVATIEFISNGTSLYELCRTVLP